MLNLTIVSRSVLRRRWWLAVGCAMVLLRPAIAHAGPTLFTFSAVLEDQSGVPYGPYVPESVTSAYIGLTVTVNGVPVTGNVLTPFLKGWVLMLCATDATQVGFEPIPSPSSAWQCMSMPAAGRFMVPLNNLRKGIPIYWVVGLLHASGLLGVSQNSNTLTRLDVPASPSQGRLLSVIGGAVSSSRFPGGGQRMFPKHAVIPLTNSDGQNLAAGIEDLIGFDAAGNPVPMSWRPTRYTHLADAVGKPVTLPKEILVSFRDTWTTPGYSELQVVAAPKALVHQPQFIGMPPVVAYAQTGSLKVRLQGPRNGEVYEAIIPLNAPQETLQDDAHVKVYGYAALANPVPAFSGGLDHALAVKVYVTFFSGESFFKVDMALINSLTSGSADLYCKSVELIAPGATEVSIHNWTLPGQTTPVYRVQETGGDTLRLLMPITNHPQGKTLHVIPRSAMFLYGDIMVAVDARAKSRARKVADDRPEYLTKMTSQAINAYDTLNFIGPYGYANLSGITSGTGSPSDLVTRAAQAISSGASTYFFDFFKPSFPNLQQYSPFILAMDKDGNTTGAGGIELSDPVGVLLTNLRDARQADVLDLVIAAGKGSWARQPFDAAIRTPNGSPSGSVELNDLDAMQTVGTEWNMVDERINTRNSRWDPYVAFVSSAAYQAHAAAAAGQDAYGAELSAWSPWNDQHHWRHDRPALMAATLTGDPLQAFAIRAQANVIEIARFSGGDARYLPGRFSYPVQDTFGFWVDETTINGSVQRHVPIGRRAEAFTILAAAWERQPVLAERNQLIIRQLEDTIRNGARPAQNGLIVSWETPRSTDPTLMQQVAQFYGLNPATLRGTKELETWQHPLFDVSVRMLLEAVGQHPDLQPYTTSLKNLLMAGTAAATDPTSAYQNPQGTVWNVLEEVDDSSNCTPQTGCKKFLVPWGLGFASAKQSSVNTWTFSAYTLLTYGQWIRQATDPTLQAYLLSILPTQWDPAKDPTAYFDPKRHLTARDVVEHRLGR